MAPNVKNSWSYLVFDRPFFRLRILYSDRYGVQTCEPTQWDEMQTGRQLADENQTEES